MPATPLDVSLRTRCWFEPWNYMHDSWRVLHFNSFPTEAFDELDVYGKRVFYPTWCQRLNLEMKPPQWLLTDSRSEPLNLFDRNHLEAVICYIGAVVWASQSIFRTCWMQQAAALVEICPGQQWRDAIKLSMLKPIAALTPWEPETISYPSLFNTGLACLKHSLDLEWPGLWERVRLCLDAQRMATAHAFIQTAPMTLSAGDHKGILFAMRSALQQPHDSTV